MYNLILAKQAADGSRSDVSTPAPGSSLGTALAFLALAAQDRQLPLYRVERNKEAKADR